MLTKNIKNFEKDGIIKIKFNKNAILNIKNLKSKIKKKFNKEFKKNSFEKFHISVSPNKINKIRLEIINYLNTQKKLTRQIYQGLCPFMDKILGEDIVSQRFINLGLQMPNDDNKPEFHKDTPLSSMYEVVVWVPLVNCYKSMCMSLIPKKFQDEAEHLLEVNNPESIYKFVKKKGKLINVPFGEAVIFNANIFHYPHVNKTNDTRWSLNIRYKNLFTPYGHRNLLDYYSILKNSSVVQMNIN